MRWRARYVDERGGEHSKAFGRKVDAQRWLDKQTATIVSGTHVAPRDAQLTVEQWCDLWIEGYKINRESTVRQARVHIAQIVSEFGAVGGGFPPCGSGAGWAAAIDGRGRCAAG